MSTSAKIILGALISALLGWLSYNTVCNASGAAISTGAPAKSATGSAPGSTANAPSAGTAPPASVEAARACQSELDALTKTKIIEFQSGSAYIAPESLTAIKELADRIKQCAGTQIEVQGHTDLTGGAAVNQKVSLARADSVVDELVKLGVPAAQLTAKGYGSAQPLVNGLTSAANAKNRRTALVVTTSAISSGGQ